MRYMNPGRTLGFSPAIIPDTDTGTGIDGGGGLPVYRVTTACPNCSEDIPWGWIAIAVLAGFVLASGRKRG